MSLKVVERRFLLIRHVFLFLLLCISSAAAAALPPVVFNTVSSGQGLPQNTGRALLQDSDGYVWVGTEDGLVRFDGYSMLSFRKNHDDPNSLSDNYIESLAEDGQGRIWVGTMGGGINVIDRQRRLVTRIKALGSTDILDIVTSRTGDTLWFAAGNGIYVMETSEGNDEQSGRLIPTADLSPQRVPVLLPDRTPLVDAVNGLVLDGDEIWFSTRGSGVGRFNQGNGETTWYHREAGSLENDSFNTIFRDQDGVLWLGSQERGLVKVLKSPAGVHFQYYDTENSGLAANDVMSIADAGDGLLWLGTWGGGLALFDTEKGRAELYRYQRDDQYSIPSDTLMNVIRTRNGQVWLGTFDKGVSWFHPESPFHAYRATPLEEGGLNSNVIWSFAAEGNDALWIGTSKGLSRLHLASHQYATPDLIQPLDLWEKVRRDDIRALYMDSDELWVAARKEGVFKVSLRAMTVTPLTQLASAGQALTHPYVRLMYKDSRGVFWFGATRGLNRFDPVTGEIRNYMPEPGNALSLPHFRVRALYEDSRGQIWAGTSSGLMLLDGAGNPIRVIDADEDGPDGLRLAGKGVQGLAEDAQARIWLATDGGISVFDAARKKTTILRELNGLPSNAVYCTIPADGFIWATTLHGLARISPDTLNVEKYTTDDGLPDNEFNFNAWHVLPDGRLALGTLSGFALFHPEKVPGPERSGIAPPLHLQPYVYNQDGGQVPTAGRGEPIRLDWANNKISFAYSVLNYGNLGSVKYEVRLEGVDKKWNSADGRLATFAGLAAGTYSFTVRAMERHGQWMVESAPVSFSIAQVPWKTPQAYALYAIVLSGILAFCFTMYSRQLHKRSLFLENLVARRTGELQASNQRLEEKHRQLDQLLTSRERLFRAIAHELRTPLAVIMSSVEALQDEGGRTSTMLRMIHQRAHRIGGLLDRLLDLANNTAALNNHGEPFSVAQAIEEAVAPFRQQAAQESRRLHEHVEVDNACLAMERETFIMIISNLLANAVKFTDRGGAIAMTALIADGRLALTVEDDGIGVPAGEEQRIFNWFEQAHPRSGPKGWGIGLAFARDEIEAAGGTIELCRPEEAGAKFLVFLPLAQGVRAEVSPAGDGVVWPETAENEHPVLHGLEKEYTMLVIEDDPDLRHHLPTLFPPHWTILTSPDAESGAVIAMDKEPDIIITDLMLPGESGFELTRKLKGNSQTAHIPIIILTALGNEENRLTGLGLSADSFLSKPFSNKELRLRVAGLLANREKVLDRAKQIILHDSVNGERADDPVTESREDEFLVKLNAALGQDLDVASLTLDEAAARVAMSKRSLQREMERVGISWREYKRLRRIRFAMDLLRDPRIPVGDVVEQSGYGSAAHFSKIFKEVNGASPSEWRRNAAS